MKRNSRIDNTQDKICAYIQNLLLSEFTGKIVINMFKGGVSNIITETSIKIDDI